MVPSSRSSARVHDRRGLKAAMPSRRRWATTVPRVTVCEPGDLGVCSPAQVALFRACPGPRGPLHPSELLPAPVLDRHHRAPHPPGQLAARGVLPVLHSLGQQPVFFLRPEIRVTRFLNPLPRRAGRWGSGLPAMGARRVRLASFAACSGLPGSVVFHGYVEPGVNQVSAAPASLSSEVPAPSAERNWRRSWSSRKTASRWSPRSITW